MMMMLLMIVIMMTTLVMAMVVLAPNRKYYNTGYRGKMLNIVIAMTQLQIMQPSYLTKNFYIDLFNNNYDDD